MADLDYNLLMSSDDSEDLAGILSRLDESGLTRASILDVIEDTLDELGIK